MHGAELCLFTPWFAKPSKISVVERVPKNGCLFVFSVCTIVRAAFLCSTVIAHHLKKRSNRRTTVDYSFLLPLPNAKVAHQTTTRKSKKCCTMTRRHTAPLVTKELFEMEIRLFWLILCLLKAGNRPTKRRGVTTVGHIKVLHTTI
jgi:hypothetical protein